MKVQETGFLGKRPMADAGGSVALVRGGALGDFILTLPLIRALRDNFPRSRLVLVGDPSTTRLGGAAERGSAEAGDWARMYTQDGPPPTLADQFADCRLLVALLPGGPGAAPDVYLENLRALCTQTRVGDSQPEPGQTHHMTQSLLDPLRDEGIDLPDAPQPRIELPSAPAKGDVVILHPGSGGRHKCWPAQHFVTLLAWLQRQGWQVAVLWGPAEEARRGEFPPALSEAATQLCPASAWELALYLAAAKFYIGNDTGPGHVAAAVGCPTLSLFGPTDPRLWRPLGPAARVVQAPACDLERLGVGTVIDATAEALANLD